MSLQFKKQLLKKFLNIWLKLIAFTKLTNISLKRTIYNLKMRLSLDLMKL